jgi:hypothetical protein
VDEAAVLLASGAAEPPPDLDMDVPLMPGMARAELVVLELWLVPLPQSASSRTAPAETPAMRIRFMKRCLSGVEQWNVTGRPGSAVSSMPGDQVRSD